MTSDDTSALRNWIATASSSLFDEMQTAWDDFAANPNVVMTLHGGYDTGKSALLRRLLVDAAVDVPEWLTISGVPTTFRNQDVNLFGLTLRDTPGVMSGADSSRDTLNNAEAEQSLLLTDGLILLFNPQLATGDVDAVRALVDAGWPGAALVLVIGRFDLAMDPADNPDGYRELADRKRAELRAMLGLTDSHRVHVVAADAFAIGGSAQSPDPAIWDAYREWDGIEDLTQRLKALHDEDGVIRGSAHERYWSTAAATVRAGLVDERTSLAEALQFAQSERERTGHRLEQLTGIREQAEARLDRVVHDSVRTAVEAESSPAQAKEALKSDLDAWFDTTAAEVDNLISDLIADREHERSRPAFERFTRFLDDLDGLTRSQTKADPKSGTVIITKVSEGVLKTLKATIESDGRTVEEIRKERVEQARRARAAASAGKEAGATTSRTAGAKKSGFPTTENLARIYSVGQEMLPIAQELTSLILQHRAEQAEAQAAKARRDTLRRLEQDRAGEACRLAMSEAEPLFAEAKRLIEDEASDSVALIPSLESSLASIDALLASYPS